MLKVRSIGDLASICASRPTNFGAAFTEDEWEAIEKDLHQSEVLFVIHVMDQRERDSVAELA